MPETDKLLEDYRRLQDTYAAALKNRQFMVQSLADERLARILTRFEREIESTKESLVLAEKKEIDGKQQAVLARRSLLAQLRAAYEEDVKEAKDELARFERDNQLFLNEHLGPPKQSKKAEAAAS